MNDKFPLEADGGEPMTKGTERLLVHPRSTEGQVRPEPTAYDWADNLELSHDRLLTLYQVDPDHCFHEPPKLLLEEFDSTRSQGGRCGSTRRTCRESSSGSSGGWRPFGTARSQIRGSRPLRIGVTSMARRKGKGLWNE